MLVLLGNVINHDGKFAPVRVKFAAVNAVRTIIRSTKPFFSLG